MRWSAGCQSTHRDAPEPAMTGDCPSNEWEFSNPGFNGQNATKLARSPLTQVRERYGWPKGLSTSPDRGGFDIRRATGGPLFRGRQSLSRRAELALTPEPVLSLPPARLGTSLEIYKPCFGAPGRPAGGACERGPPFRDFIILTDFSRCQGGVIGRVSRRFFNGPAATAIWLSR